MFDEKLGVFVALSAIPSSERRWVPAVCPTVSNGELFLLGGEGQYKRPVSMVEFCPPVASLDGEVWWRYKAAPAPITSFVRAEEVQLMEDRTFSEVFGNASAKVGGLAETSKHFGRRVPAFVFKTSPVDTPSDKVLEHVLKDMEDILDEKKGVALIKESERYFLSLYHEGGHWGGVKEALLAPKLPENAPRKELKASCEDISKGMVDREWELRRAFSQQLSISAALEVLFEQSDMKPLAQVIALSGMDLLRSRLIEWARYKFAIRQTVLKKADDFQVLVKELLYSSLICPGLFAKEGLARVQEEACRLHKPVEDLLKLPKDRKKAASSDSRASTSTSFSSSVSSTMPPPSKRQKFFHGRSRSSYDSWYKKPGSQASGSGQSSGNRSQQSQAGQRQGADQRGFRDDRQPPRSGRSSKRRAGRRARKSNRRDRK